MAFVSTDALYDEEVQARMVRNNEYSVGRLMKDYFSCNLQQPITCDKKKSVLALGVWSTLCLDHCLTLDAPNSVRHIVLFMDTRTHMGRSVHVLQLFTFMFSTHSHLSRRRVV